MLAFGSRAADPFQRYGRREAREPPGGLATIDCCRCVITDCYAQSLPNREEFILCCRALLHRDSTLKAEAPPPPSASDDDGDPTSQRVDSDDKIYKAMVAMDVTKALAPILDGAVVTPEHVEKISMAMGDRFVPLVALLLSRCTSYIAKRILLGDIKDQVLLCNNPLMCVLIGTHVTRWDEIKLTRRELVSLTEDKGKHITLDVLVGNNPMSLQDWKNTVERNTKQCQ